jgi:hypothetical protein
LDVNLKLKVQPGRDKTTISSNKSNNIKDEKKPQPCLCPENPDLAYNASPMQNESFE